MSTITIHHLEASRSQRVLWLMEHLSIPYSIKLHKRSPQTKLNEGSLGEVHPLKRSPVLVDSKGGQEITVPETGAIFQYIMETHQDKLPKWEAQAKADVLFWMHFAEASLMLHLIPMFYAIKGGILTEDGTSAYEAALARGLKADLDFIELRLSENSGKSLMKDGFGVADIMQSFPLLMAQRLIPARSEAWRKNTGLSIGPLTDAWLENLKQDSNFKKASETELEGASEEVKKSGDYIAGMFGVKK